MEAVELKQKIIKSCQWHIEELEREKLIIEGKIEAYYSLKNFTELQNVGKTF